MKRKLIALLTILGALSTIRVIWSCISYSNRNSVSIIGGADGPTSIFLAAKIGNSATIYIVPGLLFIIALIIFSISFFKNKK
ncbi:hypothetical protein [Kineothrix sedimenti]|uniref:Oxaloacetate decarboxylase n=1 Tax=Kineothrix sedimenti TaxID=3123317 RepID=A0ABZ3ES18_9FIRM